MTPRMLSETANEVMTQGLPPRVAHSNAGWEVIGIEPASLPGQFE